MGGIAGRESPFERIRQTDEDANDFWSARDLAKVLGYTRWETFPRVIEKAEIACETSGQATSDHFRHVTKMVSLGSRAQRKIEDVHLSRYACYLVVRNAGRLLNLFLQAQRLNN